MSNYPYPMELLEGRPEVLALFCSAFGGVNDCAHMRLAGLRNVTCVDIDAHTLCDMVDEYPDSWKFICADAFDFCRYHRRTWDVVSADFPSSMPLEMVDTLPLLCKVARKYVISTIMRHNFPWHVRLGDLPAPPVGWRYRELLKRSGYRGGVWWLISEREHPKAIAN